MNANSMKIVGGREIAAMLNPRLVVLVTCCDLAGRPNILTVAWHTPLSHDPPLLGISIGRTRYSHNLIRDEGEFVVNIAGQSLLDAVKVCGKYTGEIDDKLEITGLKICMAKHVRPPVLVDALGVLECRVVDRIETGDHSFFIASVLHATARADRFSDCWDVVTGNVLLCLQRDRFATGSQINIKKDTL